MEDLMKKIWLILLFICVFATAAAALDQGQFKVTTGLDANEIAWRFDDNGDKDTISGTNTLYMIPLNVEYGIIKGLDARIMLQYSLWDEDGENTIQHSFGQPGLGIKYMFWIFGASFDIWLPIADNDLFPKIERKTKFDLGLYAEPKLGPFGVDCFVNFFIETGDHSYAAHVMTVAVKPSFTIPVVNLKAVFGFQIDYLMFPNDDSAPDDSYLFSLIPALEYKLGSLLELSLAVPVSVTGKNYTIPGSSFHPSSPYLFSGYAVQARISFLF